MAFPREILHSSLSLLSKKDLKSARLVSYEWCTGASIFLFKEIYVSSTKDDLEAFEAITKSSLLLQCVRHLRYDGTQFIHDLTIDEYMNELSYQRYKPDGIPAYPVTEDSDINAWLNHDERDYPKPDPWKGICERFRECPFITTGYAKYTDQAVYQHRIVSDGTFLTRLTSGLMRLTSLRSVTLEGMWYRWTIYQTPAEGSFLARNWPICCLEPRPWYSGRHEHMLAEHNIQNWGGEESFRLLTSALSRARCQVTSFEIGTRWEEEPFVLCGVTPEVFATETHANHGTVTPLSTYIAAFSSLQSLVLLLQQSIPGMVWHDRGTPKLRPSAGILPALLGSLQNLQHLELYMSTGYVHPSKYHIVDDLFPESITWPKLRTLGLGNVSTTPTQLLGDMLDRGAIAGGVITSISTLE